MPLRKIKKLLVLACFLCAVFYNIFYKIPLSNGKTENENPRSFVMKNRDLDTKTLFSNNEHGKPKRIAQETSDLDTRTKFDNSENGKNKGIEKNELAPTTKSVPAKKKRNNPLSDYITYPCLTKGNTPFRLKNGGCVRTVNRTSVSKYVPKTACVEFTVAERTPICKYHGKNEQYVSGELRSRGTWERTLADKFGLALNENNVTHVMDIGCYIGVYSLIAAKLGKYVVSVDANFRNLRLLSKSLILGNLTNSVTLIWNAISNVYTNVSVYNSPREMYVVGENKRIKIFSGNGEILAEKIMLDDLIPLFRNRAVALKMDIEANELLALKGGKYFFDDINVRFIQMEFSRHLNKESGSEIASIMNVRGFIPFRTCLREDNLKNKPTNSWPDDVCFVK